MKRMKMKGVLAAVVACSATGTAFSQITASHQGPMDMSISEVSGAITTTPFSPSLTSIAREKKQAYLAAAGQAANFVQTAGDVPVSPLLRECMETEKEIVGKARGRKAAALLNDLNLAQMVVFRAEDFKAEYK